jgi:hypothetical protein
VHFETRLEIDTDVQSFRTPLRAAVPRGSLLDARTLTLGPRARWTHCNCVLYRCATGAPTSPSPRAAAGAARARLGGASDPRAVRGRAGDALCWRLARRRVWGPIIVRPERRGMVRGLVRIATNASLELGVPFETLALTAESGSGALSLSGVPPSGELLFQYQVGAMRVACANGTLTNENRLLTRQMHLVNNGDLSLRVTRITVDEVDCSHGGFRCARLRRGAV